MTTALTRLACFAVALAAFSSCASTPIVKVDHKDADLFARIPLWGQNAFFLKGVMISRILPGGEAERVGLEEGDLVVAYNGKWVGMDTTLPGNLAGLRECDMAATAGMDSVPIEVIRAGRMLTFHMHGGQGLGAYLVDADIRLLENYDTSR